MSCAELRFSLLCVSGHRGGSTGQHFGCFSTGLTAAAADGVAVLVRHKARFERRCRIELAVSWWVLCTVIWWHRCAPNNPSRRTFPPGMLWPSDLLWGMLTYLDPVYDQFSLLFSERSPENTTLSFGLPGSYGTYGSVPSVEDTLCVCSQALTLRKGRKAALW